MLFRQFAAGIIKMGLTEILTILGIVAAAFVAYFIAKKRGYYEDLVFELVIACVPLGILGGRLGYFLEDITSPVGQKMWSVAAFFGVTGRAGLSLYGEILGAAAGAFILSLVNSRLMAKNPEKYHYRKVNFVQMFDVVLCVLPLGLSCMSLGNAAESGRFFYIGALLRLFVVCGVGGAAFVALRRQTQEFRRVYYRRIACTYGRRRHNFLRI